jgi:hypothetical protein
MNFGQALEVLKSGECVSRAGWNGKGMFIWLDRGSHDFSATTPVPLVGGPPIGGVPGYLFSRGDTGTVTRMPNLNMHAADGATVTGWLASQTDMLAEDWGAVE